MTIDDLIFMLLGAIIGIFLFLLTAAVCILQRKEEEELSDNYRTNEEYIKRHAADYCNGDTEEAKEHKIVKEFIKNNEEK